MTARDFYLEVRHGRLRSLLAGPLPFGKFNAKLGLPARVVKK